MEDIKLIEEEELAKRMLEEKYGEAFEIESVREVSLLGGYVSVAAYQSEKPDILFLANVDFDGNNGSDNYVSKCVFRKISDMIGRNLNNLNGYFYIYSSPIIEAMWLSNLEMSAEDYLAEFPKDHINVYFHFAPEKLDVDLLYEELQKIFNGMGTRNGMIYVSLGDEKYLDEIQNYLRGTDRIYAGYSDIVRGHYKGFIKVKDSIIQCSKNELKVMLGE